MNKYYFLLLISLLSLSVSSQSPRTTVHLKKDWKFHKGVFQDAYQINFDDANWQSVEVPHDWAIYGPFDKEIDKQIEGLHTALFIEPNPVLPKWALYKMGKTNSAFLRLPMIESELESQKHIEEVMRSSGVLS